jgi:phospholipase C
LLQHNRTFAGYFQTDLWVFGYFDDMRKKKIAPKIKDLEEHFFKDLARGDLPEFTWLQPRSVTVNDDILPTWQHPDASVAEGERLIKKVYEAIRSSPIWEETLFLITYDEHGGFMDHVVPPFEGVPAPDDAVASNGFNFQQLGVRIPTIAISPWIPKGVLVHDALSGEQPTETSAFESTSIMATANRLLGLTEEGAKPLGKRMEWANTFAGLTENANNKLRTDCPTTLPDPPARNPEVFSHALQSQKPLNDHLENQLVMLCASNYPQEHSRGECPGRPEIMVNQGLASEWIVKETKKMCKKYSFRC